MNIKGKISHHRLWIPILAGILALAGCATAKLEKVRTKISNAEMLLQRAEQNEAEKYAPLEMKLAKEKVEEARRLLKKDDYEEADRKAEEAMEDARLIEDLTQAEKAKSRAREKKESVETLRDEIDRTLKTE